MTQPKKTKTQTKKKNTTAAAAPAPAPAAPATSTALVVPSTAAMVRGGNARFTPRHRGAGSPPAGDVTPAVLEVELIGWVRKKAKRRADFSKYPFKAIVADGVKMLEAREDLDDLAAVGAPIGERELRWLELEIAEAQRLTADSVYAQAMAKKRKRAAAVAIDALMTARVELSRIGQASGVPASLLSFGSASTPKALVAAADGVLTYARISLEHFEDGRVALRHIDALAQAADMLRAVVHEMAVARVARMRRNARRAALKRLIYDTLTFIAPWGVAAVGDDPTRAHRYRLDNIFPTRAAGAEEEEEVVADDEEDEDATSDTDDEVLDDVVPAG